MEIRHIDYEKYLSKILQFVVLSVIVVAARQEFFATDIISILYYCAIYTIISFFAVIAVQIILDVMTLFTKIGLIAPHANSLGSFPKMWIPALFFATFFVDILLCTLLKIDNNFIDVFIFISIINIFMTLATETYCKRTSNSVH